MPEKTRHILFVCTGNICRSPMAQGVATVLAERAGKNLVFASAGTGDWHAGQPADARAVEAAKRRGYDLSGCVARQCVDEDFHRFDYLIALDGGHLRWLRTALSARRLPEKPISRLMDWSIGLAGRDVPDPYYGDAAEFDAALDLIEKGCEGLVRRI
ncbi:protein-tyrosine-phosphatase [Marinicauda salina]|uniref:protein-tyrosine-phosphatase n=1 Tax=Marinicauda salina TaxID=2135793 RepID=A0A2U2BY50_9PROT|nr:low molecular weight protein-tyrosine-phosphatase [Marinicauda salina]PWE18936.1 protein-tyrosine-phosphatase [Marinicauda salina]